MGQRGRLDSFPGGFFVLISNHLQTIVKNSAKMFDVNSTIGHIDYMETNMSKHTNYEISNSFSLWMEYADPSGIDSEGDFNAMDPDERLQMLDQMFPEVADDVEYSQD